MTVLKNSMSTCGSEGFIAEHGASSTVSDSTGVLVPPRHRRSLSASIEGWGRGSPPGPASNRACGRHRW
jgi:hypothetical protein